MQICAEETGVADTVDPLAGSYFVEALTNEMEARIQAEMDRVERMGGIVEGVKSGAIQARGRPPGVPVRADDAVRRVPEGRREPPRRSRRRARGVGRDRALRVRSARRRDAGRPSSGSPPPRAGPGRRGRARWGGSATRRGAVDNLMPPILEAVRAYATLGEMAGALRDVWGEHKEPIVVLSTDPATTVAYGARAGLAGRQGAELRAPGARRGGPGPRRRLRHGRRRPRDRRAWLAASP